MSDLNPYVGLTLSAQGRTLPSFLADHNIVTFLETLSMQGNEVLAHAGAQHIPKLAFFTVLTHSPAAMHATHTQALVPLRLAGPNPEPY